MLARVEIVSLDNLTAFVRPDLSFDIPAIKADAKFRYGLRQSFINRYEGAPRRFWQRSIARRVLAEAWKQAREQRHQLVWAQMPYDLPFTPEETKRRDVLRARMASAPISAQGNAVHDAAAAEFGAIGQAAQRRAYDAILAAASKPERNAAVPEPLRSIVNTFSAGVGR